MGDNSYVLAIDIGTSRVAAATAEYARDGTISTAPFALGRKGDCVATVVFVSDDGELLFGDAAERRGVAAPERLVREFKRSIGDGVPLLIGGRTLSPEALYAETFASVVDTVTERMGSRPDAISLTHPTAWGMHRLGLIRTALGRLGIDDVSMISEPEAAARQYEATRPLEPGQSIAVYDLGGGTFDAVVLSKGANSEFASAGQAAGLDDLGGANFDDSVMRHVITASGLDVSTLSVDDPDTRLALSRLRQEAVDAKEALSFDSDATIPVLFPSSRSSVRLTRAEFEHMIDDALDRTFDVLERAVDSADLTTDQLEAILLIGGSSRIPLVAQRLSERFDRPLAVDADPKASIALGAARTALHQLHGRTAVAAVAPATAAAVPAAQASAVDEVEVIDTAARVTPGRGALLAGVTGLLALPRRLASPRGSTRLSPWLMAGSVAVISGAIVFGGTMAAGWRMADYDSAVSADGDSASGSSRMMPWSMTDPATRAFAPFAKILAPGAPVVGPGLFERPEETDARQPSSPRAEDLPQARPGVPGTTSPTSPPAPVGAADQPVDAAPPADEPTPTTDPVVQEPTPDPTTEPTPDPTTDPTPDPTTDPAPDPTTDPAPEPTPEPPVTPAPEPAPEPTDPA